MIFTYIGKRFKLIRTDILKITQDEFVFELNKYLKSKYYEESKHIKFTQHTISNLEKHNSIAAEKLMTVCNYLNESKNINVNWILFENNNTHPMYSKNIKIEKSIADIYSGIEKSSDDIKQRVNDLYIILNNSPFY